MSDICANVILNPAGRRFCLIHATAKVCLETDSSVKKPESWKDGNVLRQTGEYLDPSKGEVTALLVALVSIRAG